ncbi:acyltransferase [Geothrix alkalitolerans]|uniref:acyltransferase n=1 Tax=Geothrix alkalitolerans TaxID=2922724 RepID=UPI001FAF9178|nr:acyltransferase family protein [Geothrix alkalitolerans]
MVEKNTNIDLMRVISAFAVVWLHVSANVVTRHPNVHSNAWWVANTADAYSRWCVPVFVMISGALLLSKSNRTTVNNFYKKRMTRILPPLVIWTAIYLIFQIFTNSAFGFKYAIMSIIKGMPYYHLWYVYMLLGLYAAAPFICIFVSNIEQRILNKLTFGILAVSAIESVRMANYFTFLPSFIPFTGYFLAGYNIYNNRMKYNSYLLIIIIIACGFAISTGTGILLPRLGSRSWEIMYSYQNPFVILMSLCVFILILGSTRSSRIITGVTNHIAPVSLGIYLIHPLWLWGLSKMGIDGFLGHPAIGIPFAAIIAFALSAATTALMAKNSILKRLVC